jgi:hypothetical protein
MFRNLLQRYPPAVKYYHFHCFPPFAILVPNRIGSDGSDSGNEAGHRVGPGPL